MTFKTLSLGFIFGLFLVTIVTGCNQDHGHAHGPVDQETVKTNAENIVADLVSKKKVEKSWASLSAKSIVKSGPKNNPEWEVIFINEKVTDTSKKQLYMFLNSSGEYIAANFTGK